jgi:osmoprotectant transport system permease protein
VTSARVLLRLAVLTLLAAALPLGRPLGAQSTGGGGAPVVVASKPFGESYLLSELFAQLLESRGIVVDRRPGLGATEVAFGAIRTGAVDVYPEYTGTGLLAILHDTLADSLGRDARAVYAHVARATTERFGARWLPPLGFENTYAIAVRRGTAERYRLRTLDDLAREAGHLTGGLTADFIGRPDGLAGLRRVYGLAPGAVKPLAPALKYQALAAGAVDFIDGYSTDGLLAKYDLVVLTDDRHFFPPYQAAALVGARLARERPDAVAALTLLSGQLDERTMRAANRRLEVDGAEVGVVARDLLAALGLTRGLDTDTDAARATGAPDGAGLGDYLWRQRETIGRLTMQHLLLVALALGAAVLIALPLGLALERARRGAEPTLAVLGVVQTIPSIALLAFMIPTLGVGVRPALVALWLYALYPIARGTFVGVTDADPRAVEAAEALGMTARQRLLRVRLPLAAPVIMAGVRTAAVITVGAATLAAFIGAGGLGEPIVTGLALADTRLVLSGAIPAAVLAVLVDGALAVVARLVMPAHRRPRVRTRSGA